MLNVIDALHSSILDPSGYVLIFHEHEILIKRNCAIVYEKGGFSVYYNVLFLFSRPIAMP